jgi:ATP-binding cassette, subfamily C (CFTR/MRP), member 1
VWFHQTTLPWVFQISSDAYVGLKRVASVLLADELPSDIEIDPSLPVAIEVKGDFQWETVDPINTSGLMGLVGGMPRGKDVKAPAKRGKDSNDSKNKDPKPENEEKQEERQPFKLKDINLTVERGSLVCIVGVVGSGKR